MNNSSKNHNLTTTSQILNYQIIQTIYDGTRTLVYQAIRTNDQLPVVIKLLKNEYPTFSELVQFRNQYTIAKNLNSPLIIQTYSLEPYQNGYALVMEDFGGISLQEWAVKGKNLLSLNEFLEIAIALCNILNILYHERIIHKDIKPANILINPESKQVKLIDFSIASLLPRETQVLINPNVLEGTLAYISPEQTGRMNRGIDYRTDFYSLGVTFYELLTGELPFASNDPMELVHSHIAKLPPLLGNREEIPQILCDIVMKLMAKNAEDRYQSALGLKFDLESCLYQLQETGIINSFEIAQRDLCDRFIIPDKLYGREAEVSTLLQAFERVSQGATEMMLVTGFSGIGKTAVVNEVHKPIVRQRGYFIKGKYDQFNRNIPFSAFVQVFRDLMGQLLSESDTELHIWKTQILQALGDNGQVMIEVIPELERIIGKQPPATELSGTAAQNRFNLLFQKFIQVFTTKEHPLVMFLDDLQWADSASLNLIQLLMNESESRYLLTIGAYRDNEVSPAHPLMLTLDAVAKAGAIVNTIHLQFLSLKSVNQLIAETLNCADHWAMPLTNLVIQKTGGNPFFATQFLKALHQDGLIHFNISAGYWECDLIRVMEAALTDNVVEFMALQLQKLPEKTQEVLKLAACIGNQFDLATLAIASEQSESDAAVALWKALQEGLILPQSEIYKFYVGELDTTQNTQTEALNYKFLHDRVQQAAYFLIPDDRKQITHLQIGQLLLQDASPSTKEEKLFDIVNHLNIGRYLMIQASERTELAQLNLNAGGKAKNSTAYAAAMGYFKIGIELLQPDCWKTEYELAFNLHVAATEASYLNGDFEGMEHLAALVLQQAQTIFDKVKIYEIQIAAQTSQSQMLEAIAVGRNALAQLGVELGTEVDEAKIGKALQYLDNQLQGREISELIDLPLMSDRSAIAAMQLLGTLCSPVFQGIPELLPLLSATMVRLSIQFGNAPTSTVGYAIHGMVLCAFLGEVETGSGFGSLALSLLERFNVQAMKSITFNLFASFIQHHQQALRATLPILKESYSTGMETGDFLNAGYGIAGYANTALYSGVDLDTLGYELIAYSANFAQMKQNSAQIYVDLVRQTVEHLRETVNQPDRLIGTSYDEAVMLPKHHQNNNFSIIAIAYLCKLIIAYYFGNYPAALDYIAQIKPYLMALSGTLHVPIFHFYAALTHLAFCPTQPEPQQAEILDQAASHEIILHRLAQNAPMNHQHKVDLVAAEKCRVLGKNYEAGDCYDRAISGAKANEYINEEALANELAAKFYLDWGKEKVAAGYMQEAYSLHSNTRKSSSSSNINTTLDFAAILKASQALSRSIQLEDLIRQLTQIILQNSGCDRCALILPNENQLWEVRAIATPTETLLCSEPLENNPNLPVKLIQYVKNTHKVVVIDDLETDLPVIDNYLTLQQPKSVLCLPVLNQGNLVGILYLKNRLTSGVFTRDRIIILDFLCTQVAISLENARLYNQVQQTLTDLQHAQLQIVQSEKMSALGNLVAGVAHEINNPIGCIIGNVGAVQDSINDLFGLIDLYQEELPQPSASIAEELETIDLEYLRDDLPKLIKAMKDGGDRITSISNSLRTFSRADTDQKQSFNLHEGIDSTILILRHRLKANDTRPAIEVVTNYGNIPAIDCFPGQLNQVFMNILANAIDALEESNHGRSFTEIKTNPNRITITTSGENHLVKIAIADNGKGMSEEIKEKIFDHLFTTKAVGKGTGLGLAIARQIIEEKHQGSISVNSEIGMGTEFIISLPVK